MFKFYSFMLRQVYKLKCVLIVKCKIICGLKNEMVGRNIRFVSWDLLVKYKIVLRLRKVKLYCETRSSSFCKYWLMNIDKLKCKRPLSSSRFFFRPCHNVFLTSIFLFPLCLCIYVIRLLTRASQLMDRWCFSTRPWR